MTSYCCSVAKCVQLFVTPWTAARQASLPFTISQNFLKLIHWVSDALQPSYALPPSSPFAFNLPQRQDLFQWVDSSHQVPKYWSFSFSIGPSNEYSGLISFRIDWFDLLAVRRDSQKFSLAPQFKSISSLVLSHLYGPSFTFIRGYWKNQRFNNADLSAKWCLCFFICYLDLS